MSDPFEEYRRKHGQYLQAPQAAPASAGERPRRTPGRGAGSAIWDALKEANAAIDRTVRRDIRGYRENPGQQARDDAERSLRLARGAAHGVIDAPLMLAESAGKLGSRIDRSLGIESTGGATRAIHGARERIGDFFGQGGTTGWDVGGEVAGSFLGLGGAYSRVENVVARGAMASPRIAAAAEGTGRVARLARLARSTGRAGRFARGLAGNAPVTLALETPEREASTAHLVGSMLQGQDSPLAQKVGGALEGASESVGGRALTGLGMDALFGGLSTLGRYHGPMPVEGRGGRRVRRAAGPRLANQAAEAHASAASAAGAVADAAEEPLVARAADAQRRLSELEAEREALRGSPERTPETRARARELETQIDRARQDAQQLATTAETAGSSSPIDRALGTENWGASEGLDPARFPDHVDESDTNWLLKLGEQDRGDPLAEARALGETTRVRPHAAPYRNDLAELERSLPGEARDPIAEAVEGYVPPEIDRGGTPAWADLPANQELEVLRRDAEIADQRRMLEQVDASSQMRPVDDVRVSPEEQAAVQAAGGPPASVEPYTAPALSLSRERRLLPPSSNVTRVEPGTTVFPRTRRLTDPVPLPEPVETTAVSLGQEGRQLAPVADNPEGVIPEEAAAIDAGDTRVVGEGSGQGEGILEAPAQAGAAEDVPAAISAANGAVDTGLPGNLTDEAYNALHAEVSAEMGEPPRLKWKRLPDGTHEATLPDGGLVTLTNKGDRGDPQWVFDVDGASDPNISDTVSEAKQLARETVHGRLTDAEVERRAVAGPVEPETVPAEVAPEQALAERVPDTPENELPVESAGDLEEEIARRTERGQIWELDGARYQRTPTGWKKLSRGGKPTGTVIPHRRMAGAVRVEPEVMSPGERTAAVAAISPVEEARPAGAGESGLVLPSDPLYIHHRTTARGITDDKLLVERALSLARQAEKARASGTGSILQITESQARAYADEAALRGVGTDSSGAAEPGLLRSIAGGGVGGAAGAALDEDDPLRGATLGALAGGALGASGPAIARFARQEAQRAVQAFGSEGAAEQVADAVLRTSARFASVSADNLPTSAERLASTQVARQKRAWIDIRGQQVTEPADLHGLLAPFRDPRAERLHVVLLDEGGRVVSHSMETSGAINYVDVRPEGLLGRIRKRAERVGARRFLLAHNHPSGDPTPSGMDHDFVRVLTELSREPGSPGGLSAHRYPDSTLQFEGMYVIDHDHGVLIPRGNGRVKVRVPEGAETHPDWTAGVVAQAVETPEDLGVIFRFTQRPDRLDVAYFDTNNRIVAYAPHQASALDTIHEWLPQHIKAHGAYSAAIITDPETFARASEVVERVRLSTLDSGGLPSVTGDTNLPLERRPRVLDVVAIHGDENQSSFTSLAQLKNPEAHTPYVPTTRVYGGSGPVPTWSDAPDRRWKWLDSPHEYEENFPRPGVRRLFDSGYRAEAKAYADEVVARGLVAKSRRDMQAVSAGGAALAALVTHPAALKAQVGAVAGGLAGDDSHKLRDALVGAAVLGGGVAALKGLRQAGRVVDAISFLLPRSWEGAGRKTESLVRIATTARGDLPAATFHARIEGSGRTESLIRGGKYVLRDFDRAVKEVYGGIKYMTDAEIEQIDLAFKGAVPISELPEAIQPHVTNFRNYVDNLSQVMINEGVVAGPMAATFDANRGFYARRSYQIFDDPTWAKTIDPAVRNRAEGYLRAEFPSYTDEEIQGALNELLYRNEGGPMAFLAQRPGLSKSLGIVTERKDIAPEIRALWGEYGDARVNFMRSVADMSDMIGKHQVLSETRAAGLGTWLHEQPLVRGEESFHVQIVGEGSEALAPLNGLYTTPEIKAALTQAFGARESNPWLRGYMSVVGAVKVAKTVGSVQATLRNFVSNTGFAMAQGLLNKEAVGAVLGGAVGAETGGDTGSMVAGALTGATVVSGARRLVGKSPRITDAFRTVAADLAGAGPKAVPFQQRYQRYLELGVVSAGTQQGELQAVLRDASERGYAALYSPVQGATQRGLRAASTVYRLGDDVWKIFHFEQEMARYRRAMPDLAQPELEKRVADVVRRTHTYYEMVPGVVRGLRRAPMVGTFVSFPAEVVRIGKNTMQLIAEEMKDPATRAIAMQRAFGVLAAASIPVAAGVASRNLAGVTPKQEEAMRHFLPPWDENAQLIHLGRDNKGRLRYVNVGFTNPWSYWTEPVLAVLRDDETWEQKTEDVGRSMLQPFVGEDILTGTVLDVARNKNSDTGKEVFNPQAPTGRRLGQIGGHVWKALEPGTLTSAKRIYKAATGQESASGRSYNLNDELVSVSTGQRRQMLDPQQSLGFQVSRWQEDMQHAEKILNSALRDRGRLGPEDIVSAYEDTEASRQALFTRMHQSVVAAQLLGMSRAQVYQMLRGAQVNQQMANALLLGRYQPYRPSGELVQNVQKSFQLSGRGGELRERVGAVRQAYMDRTRRLRLTP